MHSTGVLFIVQLGEIPLGATKLYRHRGHGYPWEAEAAEEDNHFLSIL